MGLLTFIHKVAALSQHGQLTEQLSQNRAKGLDNLEAGALLFTQKWNLPQTPDALARTVLLSQNLGEMVIGFLMFSKRIGIENATKKALLDDPFCNLHGCLYVTAVPLTDFARKCMNRIWNKERVDPADGSDAGFAAYYATLIAPFAVDAWIMLDELKKLGFCPKIDNRDHVKEGIKHVTRFLETAKNADPEFCSLLNEGIKHLSRTGIQAREKPDHRKSLLEQAHEELQQIAPRPGSVLEASLEPAKALIVSGYRRIAATQGCAPSTTVSDDKIIEVYSCVCQAFRDASKRRGEVIPAVLLNRIVLYFLQCQQNFPETFFDEHLRYEVEKYVAEGLRPDYQNELRLF
ncbi:MAG: hypothetical protein ABSG78_24990 [Verrucomicrobiota bacterium]|jgi:hypothetical protein